MADVNYYVDSTVAVSGDGSFGSPWKLLSNINWTTVQGSVDAGNTVYINLKRGSSWSGAPALNFGASGVVGRPITIRAYGVGTVPFINCSISTLRAIGTNNKVYIDITQIIFVGIQITASSDKINLRYCINKGNNGAFFWWQGGDVTIYNCIMYGCTSIGANFWINGTSGSVVMKNSIYVGNCGSLPTSAYLTIENSLLGGCGSGASWAYNDYSGFGGTNLLELDPKWTSWPIGAVYFVMTQDDQDITYAGQWESALAPYGKHHTFFINSEDNQTGVLHPLTGEEVTTLQGLITNGMELANHARIHNTFDKTTLFSITSTNANPTCNVDIVGNQIVLWCDEVVNRVTQTIGSNEMISDLQTAVVGKGWTITAGTGIQVIAPLKCAADSGGAQVVPFSPSTDKVAYRFYQPIADEDTWLLGTFGLTNTIFAYPNGNTDATVRAWLKDVAGHKGARGYNITSYLDTLSSIPIFNTACVNANYFTGGSTSATEAYVRERVRQFYLHAMCLGKGCVVLSHHLGGTTGLSANQIAWIASELAHLGVSIITYSQYVDAIKMDHSTADGYTYTKTYTDVANFNLIADSPCIGAGIDVGLTEDILGNPIAGTPDIGAYEYQPSAPPTSIIAYHRR